MNSYINGKWQVNNNYYKHAVYLIAYNHFQSYFDIAYGYLETGKTGYLTFVKKLR